MPETTGPKQAATQFKPGESGNPAGRPKGSRNKLGEAFIEALQADFAEHGKEVVETVRKDKPDQYLKVIASVLPKELHVKDASLDDMTDDELIGAIAAVRSLVAKSNGTQAGNGAAATAGEEQPSRVRPLN